MRKILFLSAFLTLAAFCCAQTPSPSCPTLPCQQTNSINAGTSTPVSIIVDPVTATITVGGGAPTYNAYVVMSDGSFSSFINSQCLWTSSNPAVATISATGVVTGVSAGTATISCAAGVGVTPGTATVTVSSNAVQITNPSCGTPPCSVPSGSNGMPYSYAFAATGGTPPYTWTVSTGSFAGCGVTLATSGVLSGTASLGTCTPTVRVTDAASNTNTLAVSLTVISGGFGPPNYTGSTTSSLANNLVAGCNSNVPSTLCGSGPSSTYSVVSNVVTINVANSFGSGAIVGVSGCTTATFLNGMILTTNGSTSSTAVVGSWTNVQGTAQTHANTSNTDTACYLQGQGWQPFVLAPFPAPGSASCSLGNGSPSCTAGAMIGTWALDWDAPASSLNTAPNNCEVALTDTTFGVTGNALKDFSPSTSGETNDINISLSDGSNGYFYSLVVGGRTEIGHGHINTTYCNGKPGFVADVVSETGVWYQTPTNYGGFSRKTAPGVNQAIRYDLNLSSPYFPTLEKRTLTYSGGAVTSGTATTLYNLNTCPGFAYLTIGTGVTNISQFKVDNNDNHVYFGLGSGGQGSAAWHTLFDISLTANTCETWDTEGFTGTALYAVVPHAGSAGTGYNVGDTVQVALIFGSFHYCTTTLTVASVTSGPPGPVKALTINPGGGGNCSLNQSVSATTVTGSGTGLVVDLSGIGTPGTFHTVWGPVGPCASGNNTTIAPTCASPATTTIASFGVHSGNMEASGAYAYVSGWAKTSQSPCSTCDYIIWTLGSSTLTTQTNANNGGHPAVGYLWQGQASNPNYYAFHYPDASCVNPSNCETVYPLAVSGGQSHSSIPTIDNTAPPDYPYLVTTTINTPGVGQTTNPPGWVNPFAQSAIALDQSGGTRWFSHFYENTLNTSENFCALYNIWAMSPDGKFVIFCTDFNANFPGNTGTGLNNAGKPFAVMASLMLN